MDFLHTDYLHGEDTDDAFRTALVELYDAVSAERTQANKIVPKWFGVKKSTLYSWMSGEDTPKDWRCVWQGAVNSQRAGYSEFISGLVAGEFRLGNGGDAVANNSLLDERRDNDKAWAKIWRGEAANNADTVDEAGDLIIEVGQRVKQEAKLMR